MSLSTLSQSDADPSGQYTPSANTSVHHQDLRDVAAALLWACPICKSNPEFWLCVPQCGAFYKRNLRDLMRFHVFVGDKPDAKKFSFHEKYNKKLLKEDPDNPNIYNPEIFQRLRDWLADHGGKWDNHLYNEQRWRAMYGMLMQARRGGTTIPSTDVDPYFNIAWLRIAPQPRHALTSPEAALEALKIAFGRTPDLEQHLIPHIYTFFGQFQEQLFDTMPDFGDIPFPKSTDHDLGFEGMGFDYQILDPGDRAMVPLINIDNDPSADVDLLHVRPRATFSLADMNHAAEIAAGSFNQDTASRLLGSDDGYSSAGGLQSTQYSDSQPATGNYYVPSDFDTNVWNSVDEDNMKVPGYTTHRERTQVVGDRTYLPLTDQNTMSSSIHVLDGSNTYHSPPQTLTAPIMMVRRPSVKRRRVDSPQPEPNS